MKKKDFDVKWVQASKVFSNLFSWNSQNSISEKSDQPILPMPAIPLFSWDVYDHVITPFSAIRIYNDEVLLVVGRSITSWVEWASYYFSLFPDLFFSKFSERASFWKLLSLDRVSISDLHVSKRAYSIFDEEEQLYVFFNSLPDWLKISLDRFELPKRLIQRISKLDQESIGVLAQNLVLLTRSEQFQAVDWACDICLRDRIKMKALFNSLDLSSVLKTLFVRRFPAISRRDQVFSEVTKKLKKSQWTIDQPSKYWNGHRYQIRTTFRSSDDLRTKLDSAANMINDRDFNKLIDLVSYEH